MKRIVDPSLVIPVFPGATLPEWSRWLIVRLFEEVIVQRTRYGLRNAIGLQTEPLADGVGDIESFAYDEAAGFEEAS